MNPLGLSLVSLVQHCVGGTLSSADSMVEDPSMETFFLMVVKRLKKKKKEEGKGLIWMVRMACWAQISL